MNILRLSFFVGIVFLYCLSTTHQQDSAAHNVTQWTKSRQKRTLIFTNQGTHKFTVSLALPIDLKDKRAWRSLSASWNFQWQHSLPIVIQYWWNSTYWPSPGRKRSINSAVLPTAPSDQPVDLTATFLYAIIENYMDNKGVNGRECMQRAICENAQVHYVGGVFDRIYQRLFTPERTMEEYYKDSYTMGLKGVDCYRTYSGCPRGKSLLDELVYIDDVK